MLIISNVLVKERKKLILTRVGLSPQPGISGQTQSSPETTPQVVAAT